MLDPKRFYDTLAENGVDFYAGVPDSLLKDFCALVTDTAPSQRHVITANEGGAMALAAGYHLASRRFGCVYMQNSGFGNTVNPLTSLVDPEVYAIPMLLVVGWRGEPGKKDEPQHVKMGRVQVPLAKALEIEHEVLPADDAGAAAAVGRAVAWMREKNAPYALLVRAGTFDKYKLKSQRPTPATYDLTREDAISLLADQVTAGAPRAVFVCTTGMPSRELFEHRVKHSQDRSSDFLTVGSMGHASQIALGVALERRDRPVYCLDGDGAALMHLGGLATIAQLGPDNYHHVILNNAAHDSVGGQPTVGFEVDFCAIATACGYKSVLRATTRDDLLAALPGFVASKGPTLLEVRIKTGARADVGRPTATPRESKDLFMKNLNG